MTEEEPAKLSSSGLMLCVLVARVPEARLEAFTADAREIIALAERFGARSLGVYREEAPAVAHHERGEDDSRCSILLAFANRPMFGQFEDKVDTVMSPSWDAEMRLLKTVRGFASGSPADARVPYHFIRYH